MMTSWEAGGGVILRKNEMFFCNQNRSHSNKMTDTYPAHLDPFAPATNKNGVCPHCGKTYKQLKQHITKSHDKYEAHLQKDGIVYLLHDGIRIDGGISGGDEDRNLKEWQFAVGDNSVIGIDIIDKKEFGTGPDAVWRENDGKDQYVHGYVHNIKCIKD